MNNKLLHLGVCSYFLIALSSFHIVMGFWYTSDYNVSSLLLFIASFGNRMVLLVAGIVCYKKYRKKLTGGPDTGRAIMTSRAVQWIAGWAILAMVLQPLSFALYMSLNQLDQFTKPNMVFLLLYAPFLVTAVFLIKKSFPGGDSEPAPEYAKKLCFAVLSFYLFFENGSEVMQYFITTYQYMKSFSPFDIKWLSVQSVFIAASLILYYLARKNAKSHETKYQTDLWSQAFIIGGSLILICGVSAAFNFALRALSTWLLLIVGICYIVIGNRKSTTDGNEKGV